MKKMGRWGTAILLIVGACVNAKAQNTPFVDVQKDVVYGQVDGESLKLDLYQTPAAGGALRPGIVFIHGGGWSGGDKSEFAAMAKEMAERGYVAVSVNYRLAPKYKFPANVEDVQRAARWLRVNGNLFKVDPMRIAAMGSSAGGHLASMLGVLEAKNGSLPDQAASSRVNCVVDYYGRMDLTLEPTSASFHDYRTDYIGKTKADALELYREASPIFHIDKQTCPFLIVQGARDGQVEPVQSQDMLAALDKAGIEVSLVLLGGQGHGFNGAGARQAWTAAKEFLDRHLKPGK
jgi:acetyl esterase/lipase